MGLLDTYAKSASFPTIGTRVAGRVTGDAVEMQQRDFDSGDLLYWGEGGKKTTARTDSPAMQLVVTVDTERIDPTVEDDDGRRAIYFRGRMLKALKERTRKHRRSRIVEGDWVAVTYVADEPLPPGKRGKPAKEYDVEYEPATSSDAGRSGQVTEHTTAQRAALDRLGRGRVVDDEPPF
jgi:hypothetical protein